MNTYTITTIETISNNYTVTASSEEEARESVLNGDLDTGDIESLDCFIQECTKLA